MHDDQEPCLAAQPQGDESVLAASIRILVGECVGIEKNRRRLFKRDAGVISRVLRRLVTIPYDFHRLLYAQSYVDTSALQAASSFCRRSSVAPSIAIASLTRLMAHRDGMTVHPTFPGCLAAGVPCNIAAVRLVHHHKNSPMPRSSHRGGSSRRLSAAGPRRLT